MKKIVGYVFIASVIAIFSGCTNVAKPIPMDITNLGAKSESITITAQTIQGEALTKDDVAKSLKKYFESNTKYPFKRYGSSTLPDVKGLLVSTYRFGRSYQIKEKPQEVDASGSIYLEYIKGQEFSSSDIHAHRYRFQVPYDYEIKDDTLTITIKEPVSENIYRETLSGGEDLDSLENILADLKNLYDNFSNAYAMNLMAYPKGEFSVKYPVESIKAAFNRKLLSPLGAYMHKYDNYTVYMNIDVIPYREGSKVIFKTGDFRDRYFNNHSGGIPYEITKDGYSIEKSELDVVQKTLENIANE